MYTLHEIACYGINCTTCLHQWRTRLERETLRLSGATRKVVSSTSVKVPHVLEQTITRCGKIGAYTYETCDRLWSYEMCKQK